MTDRDRLIELMSHKQQYGIATEEPPEAIYTIENHQLADHLLANGVIVPPCKVGDMVYVITSDSPTGIEETKVSQIKIKVKESGKISYRISAPCVFDTWGEAHWTFCAFEFGKAVFLTKEEAEAELRKRRNDG